MKVYQSPLSKAIRDNRVNEIISRIQRAVKNNTPLVIPNNDVKYISSKLKEGFVTGEKRLYDLARIILNHFCPSGDMKIDLLVWGRCTNPFHNEIIRKRFGMEAGFSQLTAKSKTEMTTKYMSECPLCGKKSPVIASFVQFFPTDTKARDILNFVSVRVKTTTNLSYKVADMVFGIDRMFKQDKIYGKFRQAIVDIYGMKLIASTKEDILTIREWFDHQRKFKVLETKSYLDENRKKSGFEALKIILQYNKQVFEIQCQSRRMYNEELYNRETSHQTYKEKQMSQRRKLGHEYILLYEALNRMFQSPYEITDMDYIELGFGRRIQ